MKLKSRFSWRSAKTPVLTVAGFGFLTASAFTLSVGFGLLALGASCLVLEWLSED